MTAVQRNLRWEFLLIFLLDIALSSFFWNKTLGVSLAGWFEQYAAEIVDGRVPYRDFYLFSPPLFPLTIAAIFAVFGEKLIYSFAMGVITRALTAAVLFVWLRKLRISFAATLFAVAAASMIFKSDTADPINYYNHYCIFFVVLSGYLFHSAVAGPSLSKGLAAGAMAACALFTKQTIGTLWVLYLFAAAISLAGLASFNPLVLQLRQKLTKVGAAAALGFIAVTALICGWLLSEGAFLAFVDQVFISGPKAKGDFTTLILRAMRVFTDDFILSSVLVSLTFVAMCFAGLHRLAEDPVDAGPSAPKWPNLIAAALCIIALLSLAALGFMLPVSFSSRLFNYAAISAGFFSGLIGLVYLPYAFVRYGRGEDADMAVAAAMLIGASMAAVFGLTISYPIYEPMALPTVVLPLAVPFLMLRMQRRPGNSSSLTTLTVAPAVVFAFLFLNSANFKAFNPFNWGWWPEQPIRMSHRQLPDPKLEGLLLSDQTADVVQATADFVRNNSKAADDVFVFPDLPLFYFLADKQPPTFAAVHYPDVAIDSVQDADIAKLTANPPRIIVMMPVSPERLQWWENDFRQGQSSGVRRMNEYLLSLRDQYDEKLKWDISGQIFSVWLKR